MRRSQSSLHSPTCGCRGLAGILPGGVPLPADLCEECARSSVEGWAKSFRISAPFFCAPSVRHFNDPEREWCIPLDDFVYATLGTGDPGATIPYPVPLAVAGNRFPFGGLHVVVRQWVEVPEEKLGEQFKLWDRDAWDTCVQYARDIVKSRRGDIEAWRAAGVNNPPQPARSVIEDIRQFALPHTPFPATPGTAGYFLSLGSPDHPELQAEAPQEARRLCTPTRGGVVTSLGIVPAKYRPELPAIMIHKIDVKSPWFVDEVFAGVVGVRRAHMEAWTAWAPGLFSDRKVPVGRPRKKDELAGEIEKHLRGEIDFQTLVEGEHVRHLQAVEQDMLTVASRIPTGSQKPCKTCTDKVRRRLSLLKNS